MFTSKAFLQLVVAGCVCRQKPGYGLYACSDVVISEMTVLLVQRKSYCWGRNQQLRMTFATDCLQPIDAIDNIVFWYFSWSFWVSSSAGSAVWFYVRALHANRLKLGRPDLFNWTETVCLMWHRLKLFFLGKWPASLWLNPLACWPRRGFSLTFTVVGC